MTTEVKKPFVKYKRSGTKFKVVPGLAMSNRELRQRVKNNSIVIPTTGKQYTQSVEQDRILKGDTAENARQALKAEKQLNDLKSKIDGTIK